MDREIKFRGLSLENKWVYGSFSNQRLNGSWIEYKKDGRHCLTHVKTETVGQYTGLGDKNNTEIYEGDIVEVGDFKYSVDFEIGSFMLVRCSDETDMYAEFDNCWNDDVYPLSQLFWESDADENVLYNCEIVGNIYENKDLLEKNRGNI